MITEKNCHAAIAIDLAKFGYIVCCLVSKLLYTWEKHAGVFVTEWYTL